MNANLKLSIKGKDYSKEIFQSLAAIAEHGSDAIWSKDLNGTITSWNKGAERLYGYKAQEVIGKNIQIIVPPDKRDELKSMNRRILKGLHIVHIETQRMTKNQKIIDVSMSMYPVKTKKDITVAVIILARDISREKIAERKLTESEARFRTLIEKSMDVIQLLNAEGKIFYTSDSVRNVLGYTPEEIKGSEVTPFIHPHDLARFLAAFKHVLEKPGSHAQLEYRVKHKNGSWVWLETTGINHLNNPAVRAIVGNFRDITHRKNLERQKDDFLSIASHELKTPITSLKAFAQVLQRNFLKAGDDKSVVLMEKMGVQIDRLTALISDLLDVSKIESGKLQFHNDYFSFDELARETVEELQRTTDMQKIVIKGKTGKKIHADRERIGQVIINFLTNAIKYSHPNSQIHIELSAKPDKIICCVRDYGIGIPENQLPHVFERFYRVTGKTHDTIPGIGIGLNIALEIIKRLKGTIWAESTMGKGSRFCFSLPYEDSPKI